MMRSILDPNFHYTSSVDTDIRKTFKTIKRNKMKQEQKEKADLKRLAQCSSSDRVLRHY